MSFIRCQGNDLFELRAVVQRTTPFFLAQAHCIQAVTSTEKKRKVDTVDCSAPATALPNGALLQKTFITITASSLFLLCQVFCNTFTHVFATCCFANIITLSTLSPLSCVVLFILPCCHFFCWAPYSQLVLWHSTLVTTIGSVKISTVFRIVFTVNVSVVLATSLTCQQIAA